MIKLNALLTFLTMIVLATTNLGIIKLLCWIGLAIEFIVFMFIFEKDLDASK